MATITTLPILRLGVADLKDSGTLCISDLSKYAVTPTTVVLQITAPGYNTKGLTFIPGQVNCYMCSDLGITCDLEEQCCQLPDGVYDIVYTISGVDSASAPITTSVEKTYMKVDQLDCRITNLFLKIDLDCDCGTSDQKRYKAQVKDIELLRDGAVAAANNCDDLSAYRYYKQADKYIDKVYSQFCSMCTPIPACQSC